jgi:Tol biopolymer transport system component
MPKLGGSYHNFPIGGNACWSPDGNLFARTKNSTQEILIHNKETGEVVNRVNFRGKFTWLHEIDWSIQVNKIIFVSEDVNSSKFAIWLMSPDGTQQQKILEEATLIGTIRFSTKGDCIYYARFNKGLMDLLKFDISGRSSKIILSGIDAFGFSITDDNKILCYTKGSIFSNLWVFTYDMRKKILYL